MRRRVSAPFGSPLYEAEPPGKPPGFWFLLPLLWVLCLGLFQGPAHPLGDDWKLFEDFDRLSFGEAVRVNSSPEEGLRFRPLVNAHVWVERQILGLGFPGHRWIGLGYLGGTGCLLVLLLARLKAASRLSAGLCFVSWPALAEVHGWASTRIDTMAAFFGLLALLYILRKRPLLAWLAFFLAFASKESAYPLVLVPTLLHWARRGGWRGNLSGTLPALAALLLLGILKLLLLGRLTAGEWGTYFRIPPSLLLEGILSYLWILLVRPLSSAAHGSPFLAFLWFFFLLTGLLQALGSWLGGRDPRRPFPTRILWALLLAFLLALSVTGGVPARADLGGGRLWFLPGAFLLGSLALLIRPPFLLAAALSGSLLLHANLAPYRGASRRMGAFLLTMEKAVAEHERAVRVRGLPTHHPAPDGPVVLFALLPDPFMRGFGTGIREDRPLLTLQGIPKEIEDRLDGEWRTWMRRRGRRILDLTWDEESGRLQPSR